MLSASLRLIPLWQNIAKACDLKINQLLLQGLYHMRNVMCAVKGQQVLKPYGFEFKDLNDMYRASEMHRVSIMRDLLMDHASCQKRRTMWHWSYVHHVYPILQYTRGISKAFIALREKYGDFFALDGSHDLLVKPLLHSACGMHDLICLSEQTLCLIESSQCDMHRIKANIEKIDKQCDRLFRLLVEMMATITYRFCLFITKHAMVVDKHFDKHLYDFLVQPKRGLPWLKKYFLIENSNLIHTCRQQRRHRSWFRWFSTLGALLVIAILGYCIFMTNMVTLSHRSTYIAMALITICVAIILYQVYQLWFSQTEKNVHQNLKHLMDDVCQTGTGPHYHASLSSWMKADDVKSQRSCGTHEPLTSKHVTMHPMPCPTDKNLMQKDEMLYRMSQSFTPCANGISANMSLKQRWLVRA